MKKRSKRLTLNEKAVMAMKAAVKGVVVKHRASGRPMAIWKDGKVVYISPFSVSLRGAPAAPSLREQARTERKFMLATERFLKSAKRRYNF